MLATSPEWVDNDLVPSDIPRDGLREVLRGWSGKGGLVEGLAAILPEFDVERTWSQLELERRANRILFERLTPHLRRWPGKLSQWLDALPPEIVRQRERKKAPNSGTSWPETRRRGGWPPQEFYGRARQRVADEMVMTTLAWTMHRLFRIWSDIEPLIGELEPRIRRALEVAEEVRRYSVIAEAEWTAPTGSDLGALRREGHPWSAVSAVAREIRKADTSLIDYAEELLMPDPEFQWRLFHLAVLGRVLLIGQQLGCQVISTAALTRNRMLPAYRIVSPSTGTWDVWFEGETAWRAYGKASVYRELARALPGVARQLSPDVLIVQPGYRALSIECKYSADADYLRRGIVEAMAYAVDLQGLAPQVDSTVVVTDSVGTATPARAATPIGDLWLLSPATLQDALGPLLLGR